MILTLTTPSLLFSAISLIMLSYTNRFLAYSSLVRNLHDNYIKSKEPILLWQIKNLKKRLYLTRAMQITGIFSLCFCVLSMFLIYVTLQTLAIYVFGAALLLLLFSFILLIKEILISIKALELHLKDIESIE